MSLFSTILFAADFSEGSREAFRVACSLASDESTRLIVLHVIEDFPIVESPITVGELGLPLTVLEPNSSLREDLRDQLREWYVPDHPVRVEFRAREGPAADMILVEAERFACDLIVLGTHGRTGLDRLLMGSVAESVMRRACCPVLTVRTPARVASSAADSTKQEVTVV